MPRVSHLESSWHHRILEILDQIKIFEKLKMVSRSRRQLKGHRNLNDLCCAKTNGQK